MVESLEERLQRANEEYRALIKWAIEESDKVSKKLKSEGAIQGLDTNRDVYAPVHEEYERRMLAIFDKYNLPNKPNL